MLYMVNKNNQDQYYGAIQSMHRLRKKIFCDELGWQHADIRVDAMGEFDQFDTPEAHYLLHIGEDREVDACTRLIPTCYPYLLGDVFPDLVGDMGVPRSWDVWETSRYCVDTSKAPKTMMGTLAAGMLEFALNNDIHSYVSVSDIRIEMIIRRYGWKPKRLGDTINTGTDISAGELFTVTPEVYQKVCSKSGVEPGSVISNLSEVVQDTRVAA